MVDIAISKYGQLGQGFSKKEIVDSMIHPGRRTTVRGYSSPANWITELCDLRKYVILCSFCRHKFNPKRNKYRRRFVPDPSGKTDGFNASGQCDGCKEHTERMGGGTLFVAEELWKQVSVDPSEAKRRWAQRWRMANEVSLLQKLIEANPSRKKQHERFRVVDKRRIIR